MKITFFFKDDFVFSLKNSNLAKFQGPSRKNDDTKKCWCWQRFSV